MAYQFCTVQDEGRLRIVTLNRPEVLNALHADANDELAAVWDDFAARDDLWVGIVTGAGERGFSAGNDLKVQAGGKRQRALRIGKIERHDHGRFGSGGKSGGNEWIHVRSCSVSVFRNDWG